MRDTRPDVACAYHEMLAALPPLKRLDMVADGNHGGAGASNVGPGFRFDVPIFDRNEGGNVRADWSVYQASQTYYGLRDRVIMEVRVAAAQSQQADQNLTLLRTDVMSTLQDAAALAEKAYTDGGADFFLVLQTSSQLLETQTSELQLTNDLERAHAELERSVGRRLFEDEQTAEIPESQAAESEVRDEPLDAESTK